MRLIQQLFFVIAVGLTLLSPKFQMAYGGTMQLIQNGGFEMGATPWKVNNTQDAGVLQGPYPNTNVDLNSKWYGFVGDRLPTSTNAIGSLFQDFDVPPTATIATLTFWLNIRTFETVARRDDLMDVALREVVGNTDPLVETLMTYANTDGSSAEGVYVPKTLYFDFTNYRGRRFRLQFYADTDNDYSTVFRIDDVSFLVTTEEVPVAPSNLSAIGSGSSVLLGWTDNSGNETGFKIERKTGTSGTYQQIDSVGANTTAYEDKNRPSGQIYCYHLRAYNSVGDSPYSNEGCAAVLATPSLISPSDEEIIRAPSVTLQCSSVSLANAYQFQLGTACGRKDIGEWANDTPSLDLNNLANGKYYWRALAGNVNQATHGVSDWTACRSFTIAAVVVSVNSPNSGNPMTACNSYDITWSASGDTAAISYFKFGYSADSGAHFTDSLDQIAASQRTQVWPVPTDAVSAHVRIRISAYNSSGGFLVSGTNPNDVTVRFPPGKPVARAETTDQSPPPGKPIQFYGRHSTPSSSCSQINSYEWTFPDVVVTAGDPIFTFATPPNGSASYSVKLKVTDANGETAEDSMNIYVSGFSLGATPGLSLSPDPVNLATGNYIYEHTDLRIVGKGFPFEFKRFYNSKASLNSPTPIGYGWTHSYNIRLASTPTNAVITFEDGHSETHTLVGGAYQSEAGSYDTLTNNPDGTVTLTRKNQTRLNFDSQGRLVAIIDKNTNTLSLGYEGNVLSNITETVGRQIGFQSDTDGLLKQIIDPIGRTIQFQYDIYKDLVAVIDANNGTNRFEYDTNHQMTAAFDARGTRFAQNTYDDLQRIVSYQKDAYTNQSVFSYDFSNRVSFITNPLGKTSTHRFDDRLLITNIVDEASEEQSFVYDQNRNRVFVKDKNGNPTTYGYDPRGNVTNKTDALSNVTGIQYDALNNPTRRVVAQTNSATFGYDTAGNLTSTTNALKHTRTIQYTYGGLPFIITDARGFSTTNLYDAQGNLVAIIDAKGFVTRFEYDAVGRTIRQIDALNRTNSFFYDNSDNVLYTVNALGFTNTFTYDGNNNRTSSRDARGATTANTFDLKDRLVAVTNALTNAISYAYDTLDRKVESRDARGNSTHYGYDDVGNLTAVTNALTKVMRYTYDANGNQTSVVDPTGHYVTNLFDALNHKTATIDPSISTNLTLYDSLGRVIATTNAISQVTRFFYDAIGRLTNIVDSANQSVYFDYDENGSRIHITDPNGHTWTNVFDEVDRLIEQQNSDGTRAVLRYDPIGNLTNKITPNGESIFYSYDTLNRLTNITYPSGPPVTFAYDEVGNRTKMTDSVGMTMWQYDLLNRLVSVTDSYDQTVANSLDPNGNRVSLTYPGSKTVSYSFDVLNRMTAVSNWLGGIVTYVYDTRGNLVTTTNANGTTTSHAYDVASRLVALTNAAPEASVIAAYALALDGIGNHLQQSNEQPLFPILPNQTNNYIYNSDNRLTSLDGETATHNLNGDLTGIGTNVIYAYDFDDRLIHFSLTNTSGACSYDGLGNRLARTVNDQARRFVLDRMIALTQVLVETDTNNSPVAYYVYGLGLLQRISAEEMVATYHFNIQGSTVALTDSARNVTDSYAYDSFGALANSDGDSPQPFRYLGRYGIMDDSTGLSYARARYFSPQLGRFLTKDPITGKDADSRSLNRFVYALDNPIRLVDVTGLSAQDWQVANSTIAYVAHSDTSHSLLTDQQLANLLDVTGDIIFWIGLAASFEVGPEVGLGGSAIKVETRILSAELREAALTEANTRRGWRVGEPINNLTSKGNVPTWNTVRQRFWKNEALNNPQNYNESNLERMRKGLAPQRINPVSEQWESMELHHDPPQREGGLFDFRPLWPGEHSEIDPFRKP